MFGRALSIHFLQPVRFCPVLLGTSTLSPTKAIPTAHAVWTTSHLYPTTSIIRSALIVNHNFDFVELALSPLQGGRGRRPGGGLKEGRGLSLNHNLFAVGSSFISDPRGTIFICALATNR